MCYFMELFGFMDISRHGFFYKNMKGRVSFLLLNERLEIECGVQTNARTHGCSKIKLLKIFNRCKYRRIVTTKIRQFFHRNQAFLKTKKCRKRQDDTPG